MSEREQAEALKLLGELLAAAKAGPIPAALITKTERFLKIDLPPESHGQRRS